MHQAEIINTCFSLWIMNSCNKSSAFKQSLCYVARRHSQKVKHTTEVVLSSCSSQQDCFRHWGKHRIYREGQPPLSPSNRFFIYLSSGQCTKILQVVLHYGKEASTHWKLIFIVLLTFLVLILALWVPLPSMQYSLLMENLRINQALLNWFFPHCCCFYSSFLVNVSSHHNHLLSRNSEEYSVPFGKGDPHRRPDGNSWFTSTSTI